MKNNIIGLTITLAVGIILIGSLLAPTISGIADETRTYHNDGVPYTIADAEDTDTHTILVSLVGTEYVVTLDGEVIDDSYFGSEQYTILFGEHSIVRFTPTTGVVHFGGTAGQDTAQVWKAHDAPTADAPVTITIVGTTATVVGLQSGSTVTYEISENFAYISNDGDYRYCYNPRVTSESVVYGGGVTYSPFSGATVICFSGTVEGITAGIYRSSPTVTLNDTTVNTTSVDGDLLRIDSIVFDCTQSDTSKTATYTYFLAPAEVTYDNPDYIGSAAAALLTPIILILLAALVIGATQVFRRD